jgi:hypothetical protein
LSSGFSTKEKRQLAAYSLNFLCAHRHFARSNREAEFAERLNALFEDLGIGWQMIDGQIVTRGDQEFERVVAQAAFQIEAAGLRTAKTEVEEARADLSRRPEPDITGTGSIVGLRWNALPVKSLMTNGPVLRKKSVHREFIVTNSHETHSCSSQHTRGMLPAP